MHNNSETTHDTRQVTGLGGKPLNGRWPNLVVESDAGSRTGETCLSHSTDLSNQVDAVNPVGETGLNQTMASALRTWQDVYYVRT